jgi:WD40 repeat protein
VLGITIILALWIYQEKEKVKVIQLAAFESSLTQAAFLLANDGYQVAQELLQQSLIPAEKISPPRRHVRNLLRWFAELQGGKPQQIYEGTYPPLYTVALSPDGHLLAAGGEQGKLILFDANSGKLLKNMAGHWATVVAIIFDPNGQWLISAGEDGQIIFWSIPTGEQLKKWGAPAAIKTLALSPNAQLLASGGRDNNIILWEVKTGNPIHTLKNHTAPIAEYGLAFSPDGKILASGSEDKTIRLWDVASGQNFQTLRGHMDKIKGVVFSPDGQLLASSSDDKNIRLWKMPSGKLQRILPGHKATVYDLAFTRTAPQLISASLDTTMRIWDVQSGVTLRVLQGHTRAVNSLVIQDEQLFSVGDDGKLMRWDITLPYQSLFALEEQPATVAISPDVNYVAVGFEEGTLNFYALPSLQLIWQQQEIHQREITRLTFSPDGAWLASASYDGFIKLWEVTSGHQLNIVEVGSPINEVTFSPNGKILATANYDGTLGLFNLDNNQTNPFPNNPFPAHDGPVSSVAFDSSNSRLLSSGSQDNKVLLWNIANHPPTPLTSQWPVVQDSVAWVTFSPDNQWFASVGRDQAVNLYKVDNSQQLHHLTGHTNTIYRAIFSPDSQQIITASADATIRCWDLNQGKELFTLHLTTAQGERNSPPLRDFDFRCTPQGYCWIAVPLVEDKRLVLYELGKIYD